MKLMTLRDLLIEQMQDMLDAEERIMKALPKLAKASSNATLKEAFEDHLEQTRGHVDRLKDAFKELGETPKKKTCHGIQGLLEEGDEMIEKKDIDPEVRDAALIASAQRVEHYEMAGYGCIVRYAEELAEDAVAALLQTTLDEEKETDMLLTDIAESDVNASAIKTAA